MNVDKKKGTGQKNIFQRKIILCFTYSTKLVRVYVKF